MKPRLTTKGNVAGNIHSDHRDPLGELGIKKVAIGMKKKGQQTPEGQYHSDSLTATIVYGNAPQ